MNFHQTVQLFIRTKTTCIYHFTRFNNWNDLHRTKLTHIFSFFLCYKNSNPKFYESIFKIKSSIVTKFRVQTNEMAPSKHCQCSIEIYARKEERARTETVLSYPRYHCHTDVANYRFPANDWFVQQFNYRSQLVSLLLRWTQSTTYARAYNEGVWISQGPPIQTTLVA